MSEDTEHDVWTIINMDMDMDAEEAPPDDPTEPGPLVLGPPPQRAKGECPYHTVPGDPAAPRAAQARAPIMIRSQQRKWHGG